MKRGLAIAAIVAGGIAVLAELSWLGRSNLAPVLMLLGAGVVLAGLAHIVPDGKREGRRQEPQSS